MTARRAHPTRIQRAPVPRLKEIDFQRQLVGPRGLATMLGWFHVHFRPARTKFGWRTAGTGELAKGWPDLTLIRVHDRRLIFSELKRDGEVTTLAQEQVLEALRSLAFDARGQFGASQPTIEVYVWHPSDLDAITEILR